MINSDPQKHSLYIWYRLAYPDRFFPYIGWGKGLGFFPTQYTGESGLDTRDYIWYGTCASKYKNRSALIRMMSSVELQAARRALPIYTARRDLITECTQHYSLIVVGETGSGKTTQLPQVHNFHCIHLYQLICDMY